MWQEAYYRRRLAHAYRILLFFMNNSGLFNDKAVCLITTNTPL